MADKVDVLQFMVIRPPGLPNSSRSRRDYIRDEIFMGEGREPDAVDLFSDSSESEIGKLIYRLVFCTFTPRFNSISARRGRQSSVEPILAEAVALLERYEPPCPNVFDRGAPRLETLAERAMVIDGGSFYLLPDQLKSIEDPLVAELPEVLAILRAAAAVEDPKAFDLAQLIASIEKALGVPNLTDHVFRGDRNTPVFSKAKRKLFDTLYLLYVLRRRFSVSLEGIIDGLRALHTLEALAIDQFIQKLIQQQQLAAADSDLFRTLRTVYPSLKPWDFAATPSDFPLIPSALVLQGYLAATPVVHALFARLHHYLRPFNWIRPLGIGDLKVVKHWLLGYSAGEIAHIDNILLGETKTRVHRRLEKTEDVFTTSSEQQEETQRDTQTTDRFEVKRETENLIKSDLSINAGLNASVTYSGTGYSIMAGVTSGVASSRSQSELVKTASNFAREVVDKAVKRIQNRTSRQRATTVLFETEETNTHTFKNEQPSTVNVAGIYRWVDKNYKAQLYNYGKRLMFEFVLPEPAAFLVESRLRAFETQLDYPRPPQKPNPVELPQWLRNMPASGITEARYREFSGQYDLSAFPYPPQSKVVELIDSTTGKGEFAESGISGGGTYTARTFTCRLDSVGYQVNRFIVRGHTAFRGYAPSVNVPFVGIRTPQTPEDPAQRTALGPPNPDPLAAPDATEINRFEVFLAGDPMFALSDNTRPNFLFTAGQMTTDFNVNGSPLTADVVNLLLGFWDVAGFALSFRVALQRTQQRLEQWQTDVRSVIVRVEQAKVDEANRDLAQTYSALMVTYHNRLDELRAMAINDLLQGESEAVNRQVIQRELKRQCIAMLSTDFDSIEANDVFASMEATGIRTVQTRSRRFVPHEVPDANNPVMVTGDFEQQTKPVDFPVPDLAVAKLKGRYIQFLEQAFEWQQLSYLLYPYFWATPPKWIDLMNRSDSADPFLTEFLRAGSVRVLLAVTPAYDEAVLHYLATGEPWEGGPAPVIGDPLFIPVYEELRRQQDDLLNATEDGEPWTFTLPTSLVYLENSNTPLPTIT